MIKTQMPRSRYIDRTPWIRPTMGGTAGSRRMWLANIGPIAVGDEELFFVTRENTAEGPAASAFSVQSVSTRI